MCLMDGYRPGVAERLGVGPAECLSVNPRLVYARATGWGQTGPLAQLSAPDGLTALRSHTALASRLVSSHVARGPERKTRS